MAEDIKGSRAVLSFRANGDLVDMGRKPEFRLQRDLTLEAWVYATGRRKWAGIISKLWDTNDAESGYGLTLDDGSGFYLALKPPRPGNSMQYLSSGANTLPLNAWHHIAGTFDGQQVVLYVDGEKIATHACSAAQLRHDPDNNLTIGIYKDDDEAYSFPGKIAEARLWNVARTPEQIRSHWRRRLRGDEQGLVGYWRIDEGLGRTLNDKSTLASHGTIKDAVWEQAEIPFELPEESVSNKDLGSAGCAAQEARIADLEKKLAAVAEKADKCAACDHKLGEQDQRIAALEKEVKKHGECAQKLADHQQAQAVLAQRVTDCEAQDSLQKQEIADLGRQLQGLSQRLATVEAMAKQIAAMEAALGKCGACDNKLTEQAKLLAALEAKLADQQAKAPVPALPPPPNTEAPKPTPADDLEAIEGIGPKIAECLKEANIRTYKQLAATDVNELQKLLKAGGTKFARNDPSSWPKQAQLIVEGKKAELKALQDSLSGGRSKP